MSGRVKTIMKVMILPVLPAKNNKRILLGILIAALMARLLFFFLSRPWEIELISTGLGLDAYEYHQLALCISERFSFCGNTFRTPLYPLFAATVYFMAGPHPWVVFVLQIIISCLSLLILYTLAEKIAGVKAAGIAVLFFAIDPFQVVYTSALLADTLLVFMVLVFIWLFQKAMTENSLTWLAVSAMVLAFSTLLKPVMVYFPVLVIFFIALINSLKWIHKLQASLLFLFVYLLFISPWCYRNYVQYGRYSMTTIRGYNLLWFNALNAAYEKGQAHGDSMRIVFISKLSLAGADTLQYPFEREKIYENTARKYLAENKSAALKSGIRGIANMYFGLSTRYLATAIGLPADNPSWQYTQQGKARLAELFDSKSRAEMIIGITVIILLLLVYLAALVGIIRMLRIKQLSGYYLLFIILYFTLITGAAGNPRYRLVISPFIFIFSGAGIIEMHEILKGLKMKKIVAG